MIRKKIIKNLREKMVELYKEGYGTDRISRKLDISKTAVRNNLLKMNVKFKKAPKDKINESLHKKFVELYKKDLSMKKIAKICNVSFSTVRRHLHKENIDLKQRGNPKKILNPNYYKLTPEKAYILGVIGPGDGFIEYRKDNGQYRIVLEAGSLDFVKYFVSCLEKTYGIKVNIKKIAPRNFGINPTFIARLGSKEISDDLLKYAISFREKDWRIPKIIKNARKEIKIRYIRGFADSQGSVSKKSRQVILCNQNVIGLKEIEKLLKDIGISKISHNKNGLLLCNRKSIKKFDEEVNFNITYKQENLASILKSYKQAIIK